MRHSPEFRRARDLVRRTVLEHFATGAGRKWLLVTSMGTTSRASDAGGGATRTMSASAG
jgi:hypothetical protein